MQDHQPFAERVAETGPSSLSRRGFLGLIVGACGLMLTGGNAAAAAPQRALARGPRRLHLIRAQSGEAFRDVYFADGVYLPEAMMRLRRLLRDPQTDALHDIDPRLVDYLAALQARIEARQPLDVVSGYRSPESNAAARKRDRRFARNSYHMKGQAVDVRVSGVGLAQLRRAALSLKAGGVGTYPRRSCLHLDVGPVRSWG
jgi:uncharacterized protein YcbK (DUF882 family)